MPMNEPPLDDLLKLTKNRYILAILAAKQARKINEKMNAGLIDDGMKPVSRALRQIAEGKVKFVYSEEGKEG
ncbi:DNA-directed RNA polymerase subunit omega [Ammonifex thiophilus]|uniref:DNA-directed RNA polymerase subunit omega n=1 Tax=Ammonifex thiophilus TaxID=444093 RepID=A0A3D8P3R3_9THEO|nr:DNA-directed RNA polymerase subunit omega [Ammonifex thiophilus]RDV83449.1 DNA-directed RNA polymerase subunit omega [Ammonifex thiophilus]